jgi:hypothetical protein
MRDEEEQMDKERERKRNKERQGQEQEKERTVPNVTSIMGGLNLLHSTHVPGVLCVTLVSRV